MTDEAIFIREQRPEDTLLSLHFCAEPGEPRPIVTIKADGTVILGDGVAVGEAAAAFWEAVMQQRINYANRLKALAGERS